MYCLGLPLRESELPLLSCEALRREELIVDLGLFKRQAISDGRIPASAKASIFPRSYGVSSFLPVFWYPLGVIAALWCRDLTGCTAAKVEASVAFEAFVRTLTEPYCRSTASSIGPSREEEGLRKQLEGSGDQAG